jgi:CheY-like chemotaxis protein
MVSDISDQKRREAEFVKADRLESLGVLAGGIAHDFNNLLGAIYGYIDLACNAGHADGILFLAKAMDTIERARGLTRQLLTFASGGAPVLEVESLFPFVQETARVALGGSSVSCSFSVQENLWSCKMDRNQIAQVIGNIVINARQAMPGGGMIEVAASNVMVGEERRGTLSPGAYVRLSIADHGIGICREHLSRIFEPFFTTKSSGNGLGLASCHSIVRRHGGLIEVESEPGKGSVFHVFLPASSDTGSERPCAVEETPGGKGTFLVMDDESILQEVMKDILSSFGYKVVCTGDGKAAVDFFSKEFHAGRRVRGLIFDLTVRGGMSGTEAIAIIRKMDKNVPAFVASGYSDDPVMANPAVYGFTASLCKPFRRGEFAEMLNKFIESNSK